MIIKIPIWVKWLLIIIVITISKWSKQQINLKNNIYFFKVLLTSYNIIFNFYANIIFFFF